MQNHVHSNSLDRESVSSLRFSSTHSRSTENHRKERQSKFHLAKVLKLALATFGILVVAVSLQGQNLVQFISSTQSITRHECL